MLSKGVELDERLLDTIMADLVKGGRWEEGAYVVFGLMWHAYRHANIPVAHRLMVDVHAYTN